MNEIRKEALEKVRDNPLFPIEAREIVIDALVDSRYIVEVETVETIDGYCQSDCPLWNTGSEIEFCRIVPFNSVINGKPGTQCPRGKKTELPTAK